VEPSRENGNQKAWSVRDAERLYRIGAWSEGYFEISGEGRLLARPDPKAGPVIDLPSVIEELQGRGITTPVLLRFPEVLSHRIARIHQAFAAAREEYGYQGAYRAVYPIKVNQQRTVVEEIYRSGRPFGLGLEVGSKPELLAALAMASEEPERLILCNGFKDPGYIEAAVLAVKTGRSLIPVVENEWELEFILDLSRRYGVKPRIGARVKLASTGTGRWRESSGVRSKFGLPAGDLLHLYRRLEAEGMGDCLELLHCHPGSQVQDIRLLRESLVELSRIYVELVGLGAQLRYLDIGGGAGVDYRGRRANVEGSMNYHLEEYASTVIYTIGEICDEAEVEHPTVVSESGRSMVAHHGVLVFDVLGASSQGRPDPHIWAEEIAGENEDDLPQPVRRLVEIQRELAGDWVVEAYHDAVEARNEAVESFRLGYVSLRHRAVAEGIFLEICLRAREIAERFEAVPEELRDLDDYLHETYFCNFSVFQSLPDSWAIRQLFPIVPIHRLGEEPSRRAVLADLTCDSDGKIDRFPELRRVSGTLPVHVLRNDERYYLAAFLVGAYQETLGDLHNLFGETHVVTVRVQEDGEWRIDLVVEGDTAREVLTYTGYDVDLIWERIQGLCRRAVDGGRLTAEESDTLLSFYEGELSGYTYFEP
jgi:arginine decarboxylase